MEISADKVALVMELFVQGFLCTCNDEDLILNPDDGTFKYEIRHKINCTGKVKAQELLNYE